MKQDPISKFWNDYIRADSLERQKIIMKNPAMMELTTLSQALKGKILKHATATLLMSYFDDLIETLQSNKKTK